MTTAVHRPIKTFLGALLWALGSIIPGAASVPLKIIGALVLVVGVLHAMAQLYNVTVRHSIRAHGRPLSIGPVVLLVCAPMLYAYGLLMPSMSMYANAAALLAGVTGWRWWLLQTATAATR